MKKILAVLIAAMLVLGMFAGCADSEAETVDGSQVALVIGNTEYTVDELNYMYVRYFLNDIYYELFYTYYSYGLDITTVVDISKPLEEQMYDETQTWHDFVLDYTVENLKMITGVYEDALANGFVLPEDYQADIDTFDQQLEEMAAESSMTVEEFLAANYGEGTSAETIKKMTEIELYCNAYVMDYQENVVVTDEDIEAYYQANKKDIDTVAMRYFFTAAYSDEEGSEYTSEDAKADSELLAAAQTSEEFDAVVYEIANEEQKADLDDGASTVINGISYSSIGIKEVSEWLFDDARQLGETYCYHDEAQKSYLVVRFEGLIDPNYSLIDVRHILIAPEEDAEGKTGDEAWANAEAKANEILGEYLAGEMTEEAFGELAKEHSSDGNAAQGGLYENVTKGKMVENFDAWCFDEARVSGETGIVKTQYGYHIMYFVGLGDNNLRSSAEPVIASEKLNTWVADMSVNIEAEETEAFENVGGMIDDLVAAMSGEQEAESDSTEKTGGAITWILVAIIIVCIVIIIKNGKKNGAAERTSEKTSEESEESVLEATDEDLTEEELLAEEAFEENGSEEETAEEVTEEETSEE